MDHLQVINDQTNGIVSTDDVITTTSNFIEANTIPVTIDEIRNKHLIPVFTMDNTPLISQVEFIQNMREIVEQVSGKDSSQMDIRLSHPIKDSQ